MTCSTSAGSAPANSNCAAAGSRSLQRYSRPSKPAGRSTTREAANSRSPIYVDADPVRLTQVIGNLLHNAAKFTRRGGRVWLSIESAGNEAILRVRDDGIGITPDELARIFVMFAQADTSLERTEGGLGIGLALVRSLVELHGGTIEAHSDGPGKGTEFVVRLPLATHEPASPGAESAAARSQVSASRILLVDDNEDACDSMAALLRMGGHEVQTAYDGVAGVLEAERYKPDVVLLDLGMPNLNGYDACRHIRAHPWGKGMILIALTGWGQDEDKRRTREAGFDAHLVKPVDPTALERLLVAKGV
jgi:CheY-like chemotaxis protein